MPQVEQLAARAPRARGSFPSARRRGLELPGPAATPLAAPGPSGLRPECPRPAPTRGRAAGPCLSPGTREPRLSRLGREGDSSGPVRAGTLCGRSARGGGEKCGALCAPEPVSSFPKVGRASMQCAPLLWTVLRGSCPDSHTHTHAHTPPGHCQPRVISLSLPHVTPTATL